MVEKPVILSDFDCTISEVDTNMEIWRLGSMDWKHRFDQWRQGLIPEKVHMGSQYRALELSCDDFTHLVDSFEIDLSVSAFSDFCKKNGLYFEVISSGTSFVISRILMRYGINVPIVANELQYSEDGYTVNFPYTCHPSCPYFQKGLECATCRIQRLHYWIKQQRRIIYIGDGESDFAVANFLMNDRLAKSITVFAKSRLAELLNMHNLPYTSFRSFSEILTILKSDASDFNAKAGCLECPAP